MTEYTVEELKKYIEKLEEKGYKLYKIRVSIQRIEDVYFEKHNWTTTDYKTGYEGYEYESKAIPVFQPVLYERGNEINLVIEAHY